MGRGSTIDIRVCNDAIRFSAYEMDWSGCSLQSSAKVHATHRRSTSFGMRMTVCQERRTQNIGNRDAACEMRESPSEPACRSRLQTTLSCTG
jgi:hypothetical protein